MQEFNLLIAIVRKKTKDRQNVSNYRSISCLPLFSIIFEGIVFKNLYNYLISNNLITNKQYGFTPGHSDTNHVIFVIHDIHKTFEEVRSAYVKSF